MGDEKGVLKASVDIRNIATPKYQSLYSVQTPRLREYVARTYVLTRATKMLVAKNVGKTVRIWLRLGTLT